jgi:hypothetical protein
MVCEHGHYGRRQCQVLGCQISGELIMVDQIRSRDLV